MSVMYRGERFNGITHAVGAVLAAVGGTVLVVLAYRSGDPWKIVAFGIYGATLFTLYLASALYHSVRGRAKDVLRKIDHCAIYLLIAGTYTPFALVTLRGPLGWSLFGAEWLLAVVGIFQESRHPGGSRRLSLILYVLMGWMAVAALKPLITGLTLPGFAWLASGGFFYTVGIVFYATDHKVRHGHGIWHLFVLAGSLCHYGAILFHVA